jgi:hypothetical protein
MTGANLLYEYYNNGSKGDEERPFCLRVVEASRSITLENAIWCFLPFVLSKESLSRTSINIEIRTSPTPRDTVKV